MSHLDLSLVNVIYRSNYTIIPTIFKAQIDDKLLFFLKNT